MGDDEAAAVARSPRAWPGGVRSRTTLVAVLVVGLALLAGGVALVIVMRQTLTRDVRNGARLRARDVAGVLASGTAPQQIAVDDDEESLIQVIDRDGNVVASSANVAGAAPVADLRPGQWRRVSVPVDDDEFLAVAVGATTEQGSLIIVVARTLESVGESTQVVTRLLVVGLPMLLLLLAAVLWATLGRVLAPVDAIRREVDEISAAALHRRVPMPAGRDEIARLAATMNRMLGRLEDAQDRQRRLIADAAHELRSPVASIRQHAEVALAHPARADLRDVAETVLAEDLRLQQLVEDLLLLARADEHALEVNRRPVDVDDLVFAEARRLREMTGHRIDTTAVSAGRVLGDVTLLRRVLRNLADNAALHARSQVSFALVERDGTVVLDVDDDGPGIATADAARVFERFVRLDDARARDAGGSGLGLSIVAELVAAHHGSVTIGVGPLGGARAEVVLPTPAG